MVSIIDLILIIILAGFVFYGFFFGLIRTFGSLAGLVGGLWSAGHFSAPLSAWLNAKGLFFGYFGVGRVIVFLLLFTLVNRLTALLFSLLNKTFDLISIIPFFKTINRLLGAALGFFMGAVALGIVLYFFAGTPLFGGWFAKIFASSKVAPYIIKFVSLFKVLLPAAAEKIKKGTTVS